jgi:hypothetical protein
MLFDPNWKQPEIKTTEHWRDLIVKAIGIIKTYGWRQRRLGSQQEGFCILGALKAAEYGFDYAQPISMYENYTPDFRLAVQMIAKHANCQHAYAWKWNDEFGRTKEEVITVMIEASKDAI